MVMFLQGRRFKKAEGPFNAGDWHRVAVLPDIQSFYDPLIPNQEVL